MHKNLQIRVGGAKKYPISLLNNVTDPEYQFLKKT
jgi:hypothetical protein